ncbi:MAG: hypothetical protein U5N53_11015 [Mycobacterium sp.]|nr:hypothetical protein [Mycobacterium sp.]
MISRLGTEGIDQCRGQRVDDVLRSLVGRAGRGEADAVLFLGKQRAGGVGTGADTAMVAAIAVAVVTAQQR